ncbi:MAG: pentapeptide repeat-containing protein [Methanothrix sp.]
MSGKIWAVFLAVLLLLAMPGTAEPARVVEAEEILKKIELGQPVEYDNVIVEGDLDLSGRDLPREDIGIIEDEEFGDVRYYEVIVSTQISIRNSILNGTLNIIRADLENTTNFHGTIFKCPVYFSHSRFRKTANFQDTKFNGFADFEQVQFCQTANFLGAQFDEWASFFRAKFNQIAYFQDAQFNSLQNSLTSNLTRPQTSRILSLTNPQNCLMSCLIRHQISAIRNFSKKFLLQLRKLKCSQVTLS